MGFRGSCTSSNGHQPLLLHCSLPLNQSVLHVAPSFHGNSLNRRKNGSDFQRLTWNSINTSHIFVNYWFTDIEKSSDHLNAVLQDRDHSFPERFLLWGPYFSNWITTRIVLSPSFALSPQNQSKKKKVKWVGDSAPSFFSLWNILCWHPLVLGGKQCRKGVAIMWASVTKDEGWTPSILYNNVWNAVFY